MINFKFVLSAGLIFSSSAMAGIPSFQRDVNSKMTSLLSHTPAVMNIFEAQKQGLDTGSAKAQPWSGSFWPDIVGNIADHYRDHTKLNSQLTFVLNYQVGRNQYTNDHDRVVSSFEEWDTDRLNKKLSPAEKYDLLLGDKNFSFSKAIIDEIEFRAKHRMYSMSADGKEIDESELYEGDSNNYYEEQENVIERQSQKVYKWVDSRTNILAYWSGICDGWAPASIYLPRPVKAVTVKSPLGMDVTFYPEDIKALGSYLFARTNTPYFATMNYSYAGKRCSVKPKKNPAGDETGKVADMRCNDLDAGVWHATLLNRIGKDKMGFVMDVDNNKKVNNHPVQGYELEYFNPLTGQMGSMKDSIIHKNELVFDGYAERRNPNTVYLVGVASTVTFMYYIWGEERRHVETDDASEDKTKSVTYYYDLELDANGNILGGEWGARSDDNVRRGKVRYSEQPDFIWMGAPQALAYSEMSVWTTPGTLKDKNNSRPFGNMNWRWDGKSAMPNDWLVNAKEDAKMILPDLTKDPYALLKSAQPLSHIVYYLFDQARAPNEN